MLNPGNYSILCQGNLVGNTVLSATQNQNPSPALVSQQLDNNGTQWLIVPNADNTYSIQSVLGFNGTGQFLQWDPSGNLTLVSQLNGTFTNWIITTPFNDLVTTIASANNSFLLNGNTATSSYSVVLVVKAPNPPTGTNWICNLLDNF